MDIYFFYLIASLIASSFFSASEIAFVTANRLHIAVLDQQGKWSGKVLTYFKKNSTYFISILLLGNTVCLVFYTISASYFLDFAFENFYSVYISDQLQSFLRLLINTTISTVFALIVMEFLPKAVALMGSEKLLEMSSPILFVIYKVTHPITYIFVKISHVILKKIFKIHTITQESKLQIEDLYHYLNRSIIEDNENKNYDSQLFNNVSKFSTIEVRDCLVPRNNVVACTNKDSIEIVSQLLLDSGHSKILIYKDSIDDVIGFCHVLDLFSQPDNILQIIKEIPVVTEAMLAKDVLVIFLKQKKSIALVVDEYGGTAGIICIEDIIEEIIGDVQDEYDNEDKEERIKKIDNATFIIKGNTEISELNEKYQIPIDEGEYETISGYILTIKEDIPEENEIIETELFVFTIKKVEKARIESLELKIK